VVTVDIPGAFMQTDIDELIHVKLEDELVDVLLMVDNKYAEFVTHENGRKALYVELQKHCMGHYTQVYCCGMSYPVFGQGAWF
jgi:DNA polymerase II large subunit